MTAEPNREPETVFPESGTGFRSVWGPEETGPVTNIRGNLILMLWMQDETQCCLFRQPFLMQSSKHAIIYASVTKEEASFKMWIQHWWPGSAPELFTVLRYRFAFISKRQSIRGEWSRWRGPLRDKDPKSFGHRLPGLFVRQHGSLL